MEGEKGKEGRDRMTRESECKREKGVGENGEGGLGGSRSFKSGGK